MKPTELSATLRRIAAAIENSQSPSKSAVANDLKKVLNKLAAPFYYDELPYYKSPGSKDSSAVCHILNDRGIRPTMSGGLKDDTGRELTPDEGDELGIDLLDNNTLHFSDGGTCRFVGGEWVSD